MTIALRLASGGWWGGNPCDILMAPADAVINAVHYENFKAGYDSEMLRINRPEADA